MRKHAAETSAQHERRLRVAELRRQGMRHKTDVARALGINRNTVMKDWAIVDQWWRESAVQDIAIAKGKDAEIIDDLIGAIIEKSLDKDEKNQTWYIDRVIALLDRRAKLLGLDAPQKIDIAERVRQVAADLELDARDVVEGVQEYLRAQRARA